MREHHILEVVVRRKFVCDGNTRQENNRKTVAKEDKRGALPMHFEYLLKHYQRMDNFDLTNTHFLFQSGDYIAD